MPKDIYISKISSRAPWVYIPYITHVFYDQSSIYQHQNQFEAIEIVKVFNQLGYNVYVQNYISERELPQLRNVEIVFGLEPLFEKACKKYNPKHKIYYATGAYCDHQSNQVRKMTDYFNEKYNTNIPYRRLVEHHNSTEIATHILLIGSKYTIKTFPTECQSKICIIHQSCQALTNFAVEEEEYKNSNHFFFMSSYGNMLRGIPLLLEFFANNPQFNLHLVGPIEDDVKDVIDGLNIPNITLHGFIDVNSLHFYNIVRECNFIIYPSGSEGGVPGSVLNAMRFGLIPIVTPWAAFDEIEEYGYVMSNWSIESLENGIKWATSLQETKIKSLKQKCQKFTEITYNIEQYRRQFYNYIKNIQ